MVVVDGRGHVAEMAHDDYRRYSALLREFHSSCSEVTVLVDADDIGEDDRERFAVELRDLRGEIDGIRSRYGLVSLDR